MVLILAVAEWAVVELKTKLRLWLLTLHEPLACAGEGFLGVTTRNNTITEVNVNLVPTRDSKLPKFFGELT
jgi:hypothetical protein